jgi:hypothetical protein
MRLDGLLALESRGDRCRTGLRGASRILDCAAFGSGPPVSRAASGEYIAQHRIERSQLGGWNILFGLGGTPSPPLRVGAEYRRWLHGLKDSLLEIMQSPCRDVRPRPGGPLPRTGAGFSNSALVQGTGDPIEFVGRTASSFVSGHGFGFTLGVGCEFQSGFTPGLPRQGGRLTRLAAQSQAVGRTTCCCSRWALAGHADATDRHAVRRRAVGTRQTPDRTHAGGPAIQPIKVATLDLPIRS